MRVILMYYIPIIPVCAIQQLTISKSLSNVNIIEEYFLKEPPLNKFPLSECLFKHNPSVINKSQKGRSQLFKFETYRNKTDRKF